MFGLGTQELLIILVLVMVIFGAGKLPQVGEALGKGIRNFKKGVSEAQEIDLADLGDKKKSESQADHHEG
ncbi:MAG: twin-arginine translocase TatA/TatE family subunit [Desulfuromonadales bacterium]|nr:twin-arginine translocase TatA/TatE family subunit [Desulfuromonadales bacterium]